MTTITPNAGQTASQASDMLATVSSDEQTLRVLLKPHLSVRQALDTTDLRVRAACGGLGTCGACLIQTVSGEFNPPTLAERQKLLPEDLAAGMRLACQLRPHSHCTLYLEHPAPHSAWKSLDPTQLYHASGNPAISEHFYGVAVDLGTTHIRLSVWNRQSGRRIGTRYSINPQVAHGADVLTRLNAERLDVQDCRRIGQQAREAIMDGIRDILSRDMGEITPVLAALGKVLIVGNTAMLTLICGNSGDSLYQPENWQSPIVCLPTDADAWRQIWRTPHADIDIAQPLAGFIGSDLLADLLATGITEQSQPMLLADFGTNTEIAVWDGTNLWASSVPGGPAFEGVGMRNGLTAEAGAICKVSASGLQTIGDAQARGYCASGFIDAIALLLDKKHLKPSGRFAEPPTEQGFLLQADVPKSAIFASDIDIFQRAKASTAAAMAQLLALAGLKVNELDRLWICGSFGQHLDLNSAFRVGLLPTLPSERISLLANASLAGCEQLLLNPAGPNLLNEIVQRARTINLGGVFEYENRFIDNLRLQPMPIEEFQ
ncbi:ASKHA domain-containing protein [Methylomonas rosea]|uniref:ASKHA domain-containing protein n=1 Tax=Methylomonas rosea TaxID=2952227 RepID=A0ABT1TQB0_9GAMM|nr:ASKHA domain-containing protein [Methylomonas sp. WSC-7]MCQ8116952.1 ASKHA domain-containing protein [Methylomonas sp. WSC-7]